MKSLCIPVHSLIDSNEVSCQYLCCRLQYDSLSIMQILSCHIRALKQVDIK